MNLCTGLTNDAATVYCAGGERPQSSKPAPKSKRPVVQTPISSVKEPQVPVRYEDAEFGRVQLHLNGSAESESIEDRLELEAELMARL